MNKHSQIGSVGGVGILLYIAIVVAAVAGWVMNVIEIVHTVADPITGMFVLRCVGIVVAPLGCILGYL